MVVQYCNGLFGANDKDHLKVLHPTFYIDAGICYISRFSLYCFILTLTTRNHLFWNLCCKSVRLWLELVRAIVLINAAVELFVTVFCRWCKVTWSSCCFHSWFRRSEIVISRRSMPNAQVLVDCRITIKPKGFFNKSVENDLIPVTSK